MDLGCYAVDLIRFVSGDEPRVIDAHARLASPDVDRFMTAKLALPSSGTARLTCSIWSLEIFRCSVHVRGTKGELRVSNPLAPQLFHSLSGAQTAKKNGNTSTVAKPPTFTSCGRLPRRCATECQSLLVPRTRPQTCV